MNSRLGILISGRGSNLRSIVEAVQSGAIAASIGVVLSNRADAPGLDIARSAGIEAMALSPRGFPDRDSYDTALADLLRQRDVGLVCLAGFMRLIGRPLVDAFPDRILNIHPSLLPAYKGLDTHARAIAAGDALAGCSVHEVTEELDGGPVLGQATVPVGPDDTPETLAARVLAEEHRLYPRVLAEWLAR